MDFKIAVPPENLYYGTTIDKLVLIIKNKLLPDDGSFIHLLEDAEIAHCYAKPHGNSFIISIYTEDLLKEGWTFYLTNDNVWLTSKIPFQYLEFEPWVPVMEEKPYAIEELKKEIGKRIFHKLYRHLKNLKLIWKSTINDDVLFLDKKTGKCYMVHLTWKGKQEIRNYPGTDVYESFEEWLEKGLWMDNQLYYDLIE